jgi:hypothetical protein
MTRKVTRETEMPRKDWRRGQEREGEHRRTFEKSSSIANCRVHFPNQITEGQACEQDQEIKGIHRISKRRRGMTTNTIEDVVADVLSKPLVGEQFMRLRNILLGYALHQWEGTAL